MQLQGERTIAADRSTVWEALNDADVLRACIPGCDELEKTADDQFEGRVTQKVGPVKATFRGAVKLSDVVEGESYRIDGEGKGGAAGFAKGGANVTLTEAPEGTRLAFDADVKVGGKLAQLGSRLIDGFARKMTDQFFDRFKEEVERPASEEEVTPPVDLASDAVVAAEAAPAVAAAAAEDAEIREHPLEQPGAAGPTTRDEPVSGAAALDEEGGPEPKEPRATSASAGPGGGTEGAYAATMSEVAAKVAAAEQAGDREARHGDAAGSPDDPAEAGAERPADPPSHHGAKGGAGSDAARVARPSPQDKTPPPGARRDDTPKKAAPRGGPKDSDELDRSGEPAWKNWFRRLFG